MSNLSWWGIGVVVACLLLTIAVVLYMYKYLKIYSIYRTKTPEEWDKLEAEYQLNQEIDWQLEVAKAMKSKSSKPYIPPKQDGAQ